MRLASLIAASAVAGALASCGGSSGGTQGDRGASGPSPGLAAVARLSDPPLRPGVVLDRVHAAVGPVAVGGGTVYAAVGPIEAENALPSLVARTVGQPNRTIAQVVDRGNGLAAGHGWVAYGAGVAPRLMSSRPDGSGARVLATGLVTPVASRGELLAWGEQSGGRQRIVVRDMRSGSDWVAADMPRCGHSGCYRIDAVTLADEGVAFDRGAIGPQPSYVGRRRFD